jgi:hypothetical protein
MTVTPMDYEMRPDDLRDPMLWVTRIAVPIRVDTSDAALRRAGIDARKSRLIRSWGHNADGTHWLLVRGGTPVHTDRAYLRYTHQFVLRSGGTRLRGHPRYDPDDPALWHPPLVPGSYYCLDTHSPHQGLPDPRLPDDPSRVKLVIAVDRPEPLDMETAWGFIQPFLSRQITDDDMTARPLRWKPT